jgi:hypothetical protein
MNRRRSRSATQDEGWAMATQSGPTISKRASHVSEVRFSHALAPDNKTVSILFDNFVVALGPGAPVVARTVSMIFPLEGNAGGAAKIDLRGSAALDHGATGTVIFRVFGETHVLEPLLGPADPNPGDFTKTLALKVPAGSNLDMTFLVVAERGANRRGDTSVTLDSVDISLGQPET